MITVRLNRGRHKLVSESTDYRNPPSNSLAEVESRLYKTFTNMAVRPMGPRRQWVVLGSFIPRLYSGILISLLFGLNDFAKNKTNFRFSQVLSPGEPLTSDDRLLIRRFRRYSRIFSRDFVPITFAIPDHR